MSLLCGFTGAPNPDQVKAMAAGLSHRSGGNQPGFRSIGDRLHVAFARDQVGTDLSGCAEDSEGRCLALAGMPNHEVWQSPGDGLVGFSSDPQAAMASLGGAYVGVYRDVKHTLLFRDKAGRRTLYYTFINGELYFSVENKSLFRLPQFSPEIEPSSVAQYLSFSFVPGENTMLRGLKELKPGHYLDSRSNEQKPYFRPIELEQAAPDLSRAEWVSNFSDTFQDCLVKATPKGQTTHPVFLSGGIDSSLVTAALAETYGRDSVKSFGIHFGAEFPNELPFIREVAKYCQVDCEEVEIKPRDFLPVLHEVVESLSDPIGDPVTMPNFLLARHVAEQGYQAVFNGEGGDPLFGGPKNMALLMHHWYGQSLEANHREKAYLASYRRGYEELGYLLTDEWRAKLNEERDLEGVLKPFFDSPKPESFLKKLLWINTNLKGAHLILPKVEKMLGASGVTPLSPLFDERLIHYSMQLPGELLLKNGVEKVILKEVFRGRLPDSIIDRPKSGMRVPVHYWFKGELKRYAHQVLSSKQTRAAGIFDQKRIKALLKYDTQQGPGRYGIRIWMLLTFELWRRQVFGEG